MSNPVPPPLAREAAPPSASLEADEPASAPPDSLASGPLELGRQLVQTGLALRYDVDVARLPPDVTFLQLGFDEGAARYVRAAARARHGRLLTRLHAFLSRVVSDFDVNGLLGIYPMHVLSSAQWGLIFESVAQRGAPPRLSSLLDIGAGRGDVTAELARHFETVTVTETSGPMARRLERRGFEVLKGDLANEAGLNRSFDAVSLLNVLDRCEYPLRLLSTARGLLRPGGLLLIALVLPYEPLVLRRGKSEAPKERLPILSRGFEGAARQFLDFALAPLGLDIELVSRVPYLSGGDADAALYELDDLIVVARARGDIPLIDGNTSKL